MTAEKRTHWKKLTNPDYIGAYSLDEGQDLTVTIDRVERKMITGAEGKKEECTIALLKGQKPLILNNTNCKTIAKIYDTSFIEDWAGKSIILYVAKVRAFGEVVEAIRIRPILPVVSLPELHPLHASWNDALTSIQNGQIKIETVEKKYFITPANKALLCQKK